MDMDKKITKDKKDNNILKILKGSLISIVISLVLLLIASAVMTFTNISEDTIPIIVIAISVISILIGSIISVMHINKNGILNGGAVGAIYIVALYIFSSIMISGFNLNIKSIIMLIASILAGIIGRNYRSKLI